MLIRRWITVVDAGAALGSITSLAWPEVLGPLAFLCAVAWVAWILRGNDRNGRSPPGAREGTELPESKAHGSVQDIIWGISTDKSAASNRATEASHAPTALHADARIAPRLQEPHHEPPSASSAGLGEFPAQSQLASRSEGTLGASFTDDSDHFLRHAGQVGYIYVMRSEFHREHVFKVGYTTQDPAARRIDDLALGIRTP